MSKFKVGDKVRILHTDYTECGLDVGTVHEVVRAIIGGVHLKGCYDDGFTHTLFFKNEEVEPASKEAAPTLTVGKTYTSKNGCEWLCIAVDGDYAYMRHPDIPKDAAYVFTTDGTNISQGGGGWDVQFEPVRESLVVSGGFSTRYLDNATVHPQYSDHKFTMTIDMVDGEPDWSSANLTGA